MHQFAVQANYRIQLILTKERMKLAFNQVREKKKQSTNGLSIFFFIKFCPWIIEKTIQVEFFFSFTKFFFQSFQRQLVNGNRNEI